MGAAIIITSGKGGVGKTTCSAAIASALALLGHSVICVDCDIGLRNLDLALGLSDASLWDFGDVIDGSVLLEDAIIQHREIDSLSFLAAPADMMPEDIPAEAMSSLIKSLKEKYEYCIIDCPAGLGAGFRLAAANADRAIVIATGNAGSLRDAQYTAQKLREMGVDDIRLIVNMLSTRMLRKTRSTVDDMIDSIGVQLIGIVSEDKSAALAYNLQKPLMRFGAKYAYDQFFRIARRIVGENVPLKG